MFTAYYEGIITPFVNRLTVWVSFFSLLSTSPPTPLQPASSSKDGFFFGWRGDGKREGLAPFRVNLSLRGDLSGTRVNPSQTLTVIHRAFKRGRDPSSKL